MGVVTLERIEVVGKEILCVQNLFVFFVLNIINVKAQRLFSLLHSQPK